MFQNEELTKLNFNKLEGHSVIPFEQFVAFENSKSFNTFQHVSTYPGPPKFALGIRELGKTRDLIITGGPLERAWQQADSQIMQAWKVDETWGLGVHLLDSGPAK